MTAISPLPIPISVAVEDLLSEAVAKRLLAECKGSFLVLTVYGKGGSGYLRRTARKWNQASRVGPIFMLTDLDNIECPPVLIQDWMGLHPQERNFIFRIAVREVEAWLLADALGWSQFLGIEIGLIPTEPENVADAKQELIRLAARTKRRTLRLSVVPSSVSTARQGPNYNGCLTDFVQRHWSPQRARVNSPSLDKAMQALDTFEPVWIA